MRCIIHKALLTLISNPHKETLVTKWQAILSTTHSSIHNYTKQKQWGVLGKLGWKGKKKISTSTSYSKVIIMHENKFQPLKHLLFTVMNKWKSMYKHTTSLSNTIKSRPQGKLKASFFISCLAIQLLFFFSGLWCLHFNMCLTRLPELVQIYSWSQIQFLF